MTSKKMILMPFIAPMVLAVKEDLKTNTRRVFLDMPEPPPPVGYCSESLFEPNRDGLWQWMAKTSHLWTPYGKAIKCPYGKSGDVIGVQEGYQILSPSICDDPPREVYGRYLADNKEFNISLTEYEWGLLHNRKHPWRPTSGRFMYRSLVRYSLLIEEIRVERIQDISEADAKAEGVEPFIFLGGKLEYDSYRTRFTMLWNSINAGRGHSWDDNDWVWALKFRRIHS